MSRMEQMVHCDKGHAQMHFDAQTLIEVYIHVGITHKEICRLWNVFTEECYLEWGCIFRRIGVSVSQNIIVYALVHIEFISRGGGDKNYIFSMIFDQNFRLRKIGGVEIDVCKRRGKK